MEKKARELIINLVENNEITNRDELVAIAADSIDIPDYETLKERYVASIVAQVVATVKDEKGQRWVLARKGKDATWYANLKICTDIEMMTAIKRAAEKRVISGKKIIKKATLRISAAQISFFDEDYKKDSKEAQV